MGGCHSYLQQNMLMKKKKRFSGVVVPLVTPLTASLQLDEDAVGKLMDRMTAGCVQSFIMGTTGEAPSLPMALRLRYIEVAARQKKFGDLYVGISSFSIDDSIQLARHAADHGADAVVATLPYFYALAADQMVAYYHQLADRIPIPLVLYNIPITTHVSIPLDVIDQLSRHQNIVGFKDSEQNDPRLMDALSRWKDREDFSHFMGSAAKSSLALEHGSDGIVPSAGNVEPVWYAKLLENATTGKDAQHYQCITDELGMVYQQERTLGDSLWALKEMLNIHGVCDSFMMPPLTKGNEAAALLLRKQYSNFSIKGYE
jgi:dihydrodipicolinate synthase/N-acetylneuraminate lyase